MTTTSMSMSEAAKALIEAQDALDRVVREQAKLEADKTTAECRIAEAKSVLKATVGPNVPARAWSIGRKVVTAQWHGGENTTICVVEAERE